MNHLAHLFFADRTPESLLGNLAGDFFKGPIRDDWPVPIAHAVRMHRSVDAYTDAHPVVGISRRRLEADFGHYSRLLIDVFYDHFLAVKWDEYADESLDSFAPSIYALLREHDDILPIEIRERFRRMGDNDWLRSYRQVEGVRTALFYMSRRLKRTFALERAADALRDRHAEFEEDFDQFFPQAVREISGLQQGPGPRAQAGYGVRKTNSEFRIQNCEFRIESIDLTITLKLILNPRSDLTTILNSES